MVPLEIFATGLLVTSAAVLGLSLIQTTARGAALARRRRALRQIVEARRDELDAVDRRIAAAERVVQGRQAECGALETRRVRIDAATGAAIAENVELVHELGAPGPGDGLFRCELRAVPDLARVDLRRIVFSRAIWERRNAALVWAPGPEAAMDAVRRAFPEGCGVLPGSLHAEPAGAAAAPPSTGDGR
ncbi:hypothetical protein [Azospirillum sp. ST 5-10]|uniref:hypothetical protein n=1 Tax=unclassified Azospirillum TaxID=2630922 RepID=UPI003F4A6FA8